MAKKHDVEETVKGKVPSLVEETLEKSIGFHIPKLESDITDRLMNPHLSMYIPFSGTFKEAKKVFKKEFLKQELRVHLGNVTQLAKVLDVDRRSIHRAIKEFGIDLETVRDSGDDKELTQDMVDHVIRDTLEKYKGVLHPTKMEEVYQQVPRLSRNIAQFLPHTDLTMKEAEHEFEKHFLHHALKEHNGNVTHTAHTIGLRIETLHRKLKKLGLK